MKLSSPTTQNPQLQSPSQSTLSAIASPFFVTRTLRITLPKKSESLVIRFEMENTSHGFSREARVEVVRFVEGAGSDPAIVAVPHQIKRIGFTQSDVDFSADGDFRFLGCQLGLMGSTGHVVSAAGEKSSVTWDFNFVRDADATHFDSFPKGLRFFTGQTGQCKTLFASMPVRGSLSIGGNAIDLTDARASLFEDSGKRRLFSHIRCQSSTWIDQNGREAPFLMDVFSGEARMGALMGSLRTPRFTTLYLQTANDSHILNSTWTSLRTRSQFQMHAWHIESDAGTFRAVVEIQSNPQTETVSRAFDTDQSPLIRRINPRATAHVHLYRLGKLTHSFRTLAAYLERLDHLNQ